MKRLLFVLFLASTTLAVSQQPAPKIGGRFQLITATVSDTSGATSPELVNHVVFLLDTETGQVWRYFPRVGGVRDLKPQDQYEPTDGKTTNGISPGAFAPVPKIELTGKPATH